MENWCNLTLSFCLLLEIPVQDYICFILVNNFSKIWKNYANLLGSGFLLFSPLFMIYMYAMWHTYISYDFCTPNKLNFTNDGEINDTKYSYIPVSIYIALNITME